MTTPNTPRPHIQHDSNHGEDDVPPPARSKHWTCARCGRDHSAYRCWPEGHLCRTCVLAAIDIHGVCPGCGDQRILPGRRGDGAPICPTRARIRHGIFRCSRCGIEGRHPHHDPHHRRHRRRGRRDDTATRRPARPRFPNRSPRSSGDCSRSDPPTAPATGCSPATAPASPSTTSATARAYAISESRCGSPASPPSDSSHCRRPHPSSPRRSCSTTPPPSARPSTPAASGTATPRPPAQLRSQEHTADEYAALPVSNPASSA